MRDKKPHYFISYLEVLFSKCFSEAISSVALCDHLFMFPSLSGVLVWFSCWHSGLPILDTGT